MKKLESYIRELVTGVGFQIDEDDYLVTKSGKSISLKGLGIVIPNEQNIKNMNKIVNGEVKQSYNLFNPFTEDEIKRNDMLSILMSYMSVELTVNCIQGVLMKLLATLLDDAKVDETSVSTKNWIISLRKEIGARGSLLDKKSYKEIKGYLEDILINGKQLIRIRLARGDVIEGVKYNRVAKLDTTVYDLISDVDNKEFKLSQKSRIILKSAIDYILPEIGNMITGSKSKRYPSFISAMKLYNEVGVRLNYLVSELGFIRDEDEEVDEYVTKIFEDEDYIETLYREVDYLPLQQSSIGVDMAEKISPKLNLSTGENLTTSSNASLDPLEEFKASLNPPLNKSGFMNNGSSILDGRHGINGLGNDLSIENALMTRSTMAFNSPAISPLDFNGGGVFGGVSNNDIFGITSPRNVFGGTPSNSFGSTPGGIFGGSVFGQ